VNAIQKPLSGLQNVFQKPHFKGFGSGFAEFHAKLDADTLFDFSIYRRQTKHEVEKALV
jgi:hypothetical protein